MQSTEIGDLVHFSARGAIARHFDGINNRIMRRLLLITTPVAATLLLVFSSDGHLSQGLSWAPALLLTLAMFFLRSGPLYARYSRQFTMLYWVLVAGAVAYSFPEPEASFAFAGFVLPIILLRLRLLPLEYLALAGVDLGAMVWTLFRQGMPEAAFARIGMATGSIVWTGLVLWVAIVFARRAREAFLVIWRREVARERDRSRMRTELEDAREIQLSMLPVGAPSLEWVDFSSVSLPASEVGGDYFDYFELPESRLVIVIGDVAGHGVASGLVLSGVRSSLYLLQDELVRPIEVLRRLHRMLRETVGGRLFVTFQIALLDPGLGRVTVANAGHPPLFLASRNGRVTRLGGNSLPLGTPLEGEFSEETEALGEGDALLLFSDGVPEVRNLHGEGFGDRRSDPVRCRRESAMRSAAGVRSADRQCPRQRERADFTAYRQTGRPRCPTDLHPNDPGRAVNTGGHPDGNHRLFQHHR